MGVFKNEVGRPSNEVIKKRNIFKGLCVLLVIVVIVLLAYILNDKGVFDTKNTEKNSNNNQNITTTTKQVGEIEKFDKAKVTVKNIGDNGVIDNAKEIYIYGNKLNYDYVTEGVSNIIPIDDVAFLEIYGIDSNYYILVNQKGEVIKDFNDENYMICTNNMGFDEDCYGYEINGNKIKYTLIVRGQDQGILCSYNDKNAFYEYAIEYSNGSLKKTKKIKSYTGNEIIKKYNIDCSN